METPERDDVPAWEASVELRDGAGAEEGIALTRVTEYEGLIRGTVSGATWRQFFGAEDSVITVEI
jgi:hypothetical protein